MARKLLNSESVYSESAAEPADGVMRLRLGKGGLAALSGVDTGLGLVWLQLG